jgi:hypothetical protein
MAKTEHPAAYASILRALDRTRKQRSQFYLRRESRWAGGRALTGESQGPAVKLRTGFAGDGGRTSPGESLGVRGAGGSRLAKARGRTSPGELPGTHARSRAEDWRRVANPSGARWGKVMRERAGGGERGKKSRARGGKPDETVVSGPGQEPTRMGSGWGIWVPTQISGP